MNEEVKNVEETEVNETFEFMDNHGNKFEIPKVIKNGDKEIPIQTLLGHAISKTRKDTQSKIESKYSEYITELNTIKSEYEQTKSKLDEFQLNGLSDEKEKELVQLKRKLESYENEKKKNEELAKLNFEKFKDEKIKSDIYSSINGYDLHNSDQTMKIFMNEVNIDFLEEDGKYKTVVKAVLPNEKGEFEEIEGTPKSIFGKWIGLQSNSYLIKNNLQSGGGTSKTGAIRSSNGQLVYKRSQLQNNENIRKEYAEKKRLGVDVSIIEG